MAKEAKRNMQDAYLSLYQSLKKRLEKLEARVKTLEAAQKR